MHSNKNLRVSIMISLEEIEVLKSYTRTTKRLLESMADVINEAKEKRNPVKKIKITYSLKDLNTIIKSIADKANEKDSPDSIQYVLDNLFGRLAKNNEALNIFPA